MSGLFRLRAFSFIKIPSNHVGNFRKAVIFIAVEYVFLNFGVSQLYLD